MDNAASVYPENFPQKRQKRRKLKMDSEDENGYTTVEFPLSTISSESATERGSVESAIEPSPPAHTPIFVHTNIGRSKVMWDPYEAADKSAAILTTENEVLPFHTKHLGEWNVPDASQNSTDLKLFAPPSNLESPKGLTELPLAKKSTLNALIAAGLLPSDSYTSVVLDTKTFRPRPRPRTEDAVINGTTAEGGLARPFGTARPAWTTESGIENGVGRNFTPRSSKDVWKSPKYLDDELPLSRRFGRSEIGGSEYSSNA